MPNKLTAIFCGDALEYMESSVLEMGDEFVSPKALVIVDDYWAMCARNQALVKLSHCMSCIKSTPQ
ncbi:Uncharacterised protein [BD1-7 clade bacterium]|uniref:Uncharacterized protein n=1 Tax=BD1-7 clade bacterium TaxID=2029982 RepID=A0A5S9QEH4_9GAMM|nr:Uncharacterised protein [BD1-7 clade bacterium]CAA0115819.1 Uncharacterised protein [BD1-7 clade bacterium]